MRITTKEEAIAAIDAVAEWLESVEPEPRPKGHRGYFMQPIDKVARDFCTQLMNAAEVDDRGGCPYCQS